MTSNDSRMTSVAPWIVLAGLVGGIAFTTAQVLEGFPQHIAGFMGSQIIQRGGYSTSLQGLIGWGVHFGVSLSYAALYGIVANLPSMPRARPVRWGVGLALVLLLGWLTTLITAPAIGVTIGVLSGQGLPETLAPLNVTFGWSFWNHVLFFLICFALTVVVPDLRRSR